MNGLIRRILSADSAVYKTHKKDLLWIAENHAKVGPVPSLALLNRLAQIKVPSNDHSQSQVQQTIVYCLTPNLVDSVPFLPPNLAIDTFSTLSILAPEESRRALCLIQDKWFENWNPAAIEKGTRRPKTKMNIQPLYDSDDRISPTMSSYHALSALTNESLSRAVINLPCFDKYTYLQPIITALKNEHSKRTKPKLDIST